jgi:hypothetical protein
MTSDPPVSPLRRRDKILAYIAVWLVALFATDPSASLLPLVYMFPLGLAKLAYPPSLRDEGWALFVVCYAVYLIHAVCFFRSRVRRSTYLLFAILVALLFCNVVGCHRMINVH